MEQEFLVTVPEGYAPGQTLRYRTPYSGDTIYEVIVPYGFAAGDRIRVSLPIQEESTPEQRPPRRWSEQEIDTLIADGGASLEETINNRIQREQDNGDESQLGGRKLIKKSRKRKSHKRKSHKRNSLKRKSKSKSRKRKSYKKKILIEK